MLLELDVCSSRILTLNEELRNIRIVIGRVLSILLISLEQRSKILPFGMISKNSIGDFITLWYKLLKRWTDASKDAKENVILVPNVLSAFYVRIHAELEKVFYIFGIFYNLTYFVVFVLMSVRICVAFSLGS